MIENVTDTCAVCRKRRKCSQSPDDADKLTGKVASWSPRYCVRECLSLSPGDRKAKRLRLLAERQAQPRPRFAYPCIGGPLDGEHATTTDFYGDGMYAHLSDEYHEFNSAYGAQKKIGGRASMIYVHDSFDLTLARPKDR